MKAETEISEIRNSGMDEEMIGDRIFMLFKQDLLQGMQSEVISKMLLPLSSNSITQTLLRNRIPISRAKASSWDHCLWGNELLLIALHRVDSNSR